jgi:hypothetical protein
MRQPSSHVRKTPLAAGRAIINLPIGSVFLDPSNPRVHSREQIRAIARSIEAFDFNVPILVDKADRIVAGHGRLEAAKQLKLAEVPVIRLEHLTEAQAKAFMLADNKLTDRSTWDNRKVAIVLKELSKIALDFEIAATGFEPPEIDLRIRSLDSSEESTDPVDAFEASGGPPVSRLDDLWILGHHRLFCGSALDSQAYDALLAGEKAAAVFTAPRYNVQSGSHEAGKGGKKHCEFPKAAGEVTDDDFDNFLVEAFSLMLAHSVGAQPSLAAWTGRTSSRS